MSTLFLTLFAFALLITGCGNQGAGVSTDTQSSTTEGEANKFYRTKAATVEQKTTATMSMPVMPLIGSVWGELDAAEKGVSQAACMPLWREAARGKPVEGKPRALPCAFVMGYRFAFTPTMGWPMHPDESGSIVYLSAALAHLLSVNNLASEIAAELSTTPRRDPEEAKAEIHKLLEARRTQLLTVYPFIADFYKQHGVIDLSGKTPGVDFSRGAYHVNLSAGGAMVQYAGVDWFGKGNLSGKRYDIAVGTTTGAGITKTRMVTSSEEQTLGASTTTKAGVGK